MPQTACRWFGSRFGVPAVGIPTVRGDSQTSGLEGAGALALAVRLPDVKDLNYDAGKANS